MDFFWGLIIGYLIGCPVVSKKHRAGPDRGGIGVGDKPYTPPPRPKR